MIHMHQCNKAYSFEMHIPQVYVFSINIIY